MLGGPRRTWPTTRRRRTARWSCSSAVSNDHHLLPNQGGKKMSTNNEQTGRRTIIERRRQIETKALTIDGVKGEVTALIDANKHLNAFITVLLEDASNGNPNL